MTDDTPIFDKVNQPTFGDISNVEKPEPILGPITAENETVKTDKKWWERLLNPTFRRWAYGVTGAAITVAFTLAGKPEFIPLILPLAMAIYFVDKSGESQ